MTGSELSAGSVAPGTTFDLSFSFRSLGGLMGTENYCFRIQEIDRYLSPGWLSDRWLLSNNYYWIELEVGNQSGTVVVTRIDQMGSPTFINRYSGPADQTLLGIPLIKTINAAGVAQHAEFDFTAVQVTGLGSITPTGAILPVSVSTTGAVAPGNAFSLPITGLEPSGSPYYFMVFEDQQTPLAKGWLLSENVYWVEVEVVADGVGGSIATIVDAASEIGGPDEATLPGTGNEFVNLFTHDFPKPPGPDDPQPDPGSTPQTSDTLSQTARALCLLVSSTLLSGYGFCRRKPLS
jgi:hypothetical protein